MKLSSLLTALLVSTSLLVVPACKKDKKKADDKAETAPADDKTAGKPAGDMAGGEAKAEPAAATGDEAKADPAAAGDDKAAAGGEKKEGEKGGW